MKAELTIEGEVGKADFNLIQQMETLSSELPPGLGQIIRQWASWGGLCGDRLHHTTREFRKW